VKTEGAISAGQVKASLAAYFAVVGILSPYLGLYLDGVGLGAADIALLLALPQVTRIFAPPIWGWTADHFRRPELVLVISAVMMITAALLLLQVGQNVLLIGCVLLVFYGFSAAQMPIVEAHAINVAKGHAGLYGDMRVWGSIGFIGAVIVFGRLLDSFGKNTVPWGLAVLSAVLLYVCSRYKRLPPLSSKETASPIGPKMRQPKVQWMLSSCMFHVLAHSALYTFFSLYLSRLGYSATLIGVFWAIGVATEIIWFKFQQRFFSIVSDNLMLMICACTAAARFGLLGVLGGLEIGFLSVALLCILQCSHALTFAAHHTAAMNKMHQWFDASQQSRAQSVFVALVYGVGGAAGSAIAGLVWEKFSPQAAFYVSAASALVAFTLAFIAKRVDEESGEQNTVSLR
jgi:MFS transporter, PPP family, 3-phenylpropionic acid transporter